ncbi:hypothetical protein BABINDRAFT_167121 [Babjeviella inositovora NRRL Y-12698]|uniref:Protein STB3 n=1 Tax=Babjeviella inositovora NRRL Y-12698 TaxID=984486 RepID=A0A1E3QQQ7_9ASCO|nr:uncharacterized protein BABINDRAFT_167121 [Babjeviella inositovora NRRL Y-12698]ODQ80023.1 hypothetical protein BABINDRAFT_167121 [Babjeviella inositovora NRRL Y-12698]
MSPTPNNGSPVPAKDGATTASTTNSTSPVPIAIGTTLMPPPTRPVHLNTPRTIANTQNATHLDEKPRVVITHLDSNSRVASKITHLDENSRAMANANSRTASNDVSARRHSWTSPIQKPGAHQKPLSTSSPVGIAAALQVNATRLAQILITNGPLPIRHITNHLSKAIPGFSQLSLSKQRRLIMAALELQDPVTTCVFEKVGWGQWAARKQGSDVIEGKQAISLQEIRSSKPKMGWGKNDEDVDMEDEPAKRTMTKPVSSTALRVARRESITPHAAKVPLAPLIDGTLSLAVTSSSESEDDADEEVFMFDDDDASKPTSATRSPRFTSPTRATLAPPNIRSRRHSTNSLASYNNRIAKPSHGFRSRLGSFGSPDSSFDADFIDVEDVRSSSRGRRPTGTIGSIPNSPLHAGFILDAAALPHRTNRGSFSSVLASGRQSFLRSTGASERVASANPSTSTSPGATATGSHLLHSQHFRSLNDLVLATAIAEAGGTAADFDAMVDEHAVESWSESESRSHSNANSHSHSEEPEENTDEEDWKSMGAATLRLEVLEKNSGVV